MISPLDFISSQLPDQLVAPGHSPAEAVLEERPRRAEKLLVPLEAPVRDRFRPLLDRPAEALVIGAGRRRRRGPDRLFQKALVAEKVLGDPDPQAVRRRLGHEVIEGTRA